MKTLSLNFHQKKNLTGEIDSAHLLNGYPGVYIGTGASIDLSSAQFDILIKTRVTKTKWRPRWRLFSKLSGKLIQDKPGFRLVSSLFTFLSFWIKFLEEKDFICCKAPCLNCRKVQWLYDNFFFFFGTGGFSASLDLLCRAWFSWFSWIFLRSAN